MAKPRVIISSDIGGSDPDDMESMAHVLLYADRLDIQAIISTPTRHDGRVSDIYTALDAYTKDYANLKTWGAYPPPDYLKSVVYQGNIEVPGPSGYSTSTEGSKAIISAAHEASATDPLYILAWGAMTDVAQALHDDPSIAGNIRVLSSNSWNGMQDPYSRDYVYNNFKDVWWIESSSTFRGIYVNADGVEGNPFQMAEAKGHGALGDYFYYARPWGVKMGDTWSVAYLLDQIDNNNPGGDSWGGTFVKTGHGPNFWTDDTNPLYKLGTYNGAAYVREHQLEIYKDAYKQFDKAKSANPSANVDDPITTPDTGTGNDVLAGDDRHAVTGGTKHYFNTNYLLMNDKGLDGGLKVVSIADKSENGVTLEKWADGTVVYRAGTASGTDRIDYVLSDVDGSTDIGTVIITVNGTTTSTSSSSTTISESTATMSDSTTTLLTGADNGIVAGDDHYKVDAGETLYLNTRYVTGNDTGGTGALSVVAVDAVSERGVKVSWGAEGTSADGTLIYRAPVGFEGTDKITYKVVDQAGHSDLGSILVHASTLI